MFLRIFLAAGLFLLVFFVHSSSRVVVSTDSMWSIYLAQSLIKDGDLLLDEYRPLAKQRKNYGLRKRHGHLYSYFPIGTAVMAAPFVWAYNISLPKVLEILPGFPEPKVSGEISAENMNLPLQRTIASIFVASTVVIIFFLALSQVSLSWAIALALIAAFCTPLWSTASRGLWQHGPSALLLSIALLMLTQFKSRPIVAGFSGAILAFAYIVRPTNAVAILCFGSLILFSDRQAFRIFILTSLLIFLPFFAISYDFFGKILPPYYKVSRLSLGWHLPEALVGNLFSPNRGLFFLCPILLPALWSMKESIRISKMSPLSLAVLAAFCGHLLAISLFPEWWGGHAFGPRYMTETIPYVMYFFCILIRENRFSQRAYLSLLVAGLLSFYIHFQGATDLRTFNWNIYPSNIDRKPQRVWDISDLQFLR